MTGVIESAEPLVVEADSGILSGTSEAVFSVDRTRRYLLVRLWESVAPMTWIMLNPSTADAFKADPTIKRCMTFAQSSCSIWTPLKRSCTAGSLSIPARQRLTADDTPR